MSEKGMTLLETMIALVILGLVVAGFLELFGVSSRVAGEAETWTHAISYAEQGMEVAKLDLSSAISQVNVPEPGFERTIAIRDIDARLQLVTVTVTFPNGGRFNINRLFPKP